MAEGGRTVCLDCLSSSCRGGSCKYTHEAKRRNVRNANIVCNFFKKGFCKYGNFCRYQHSTDNENINSVSESRYNEHTSELSCQRTESHSPSNNVNAVHYNLQNFNLPRTVKKISGRPDSPDWVKAPEFVPKSNKTYSDAVKLNNCVIDSQPLEFCVMYLYIGACPYGGECPCIHGDLCELCSKYCLLPDDERQRNHHIKHCEQELERDMELSFAIQRSLDKTCGICMDVIMDKATNSERFFGILENCIHVFCLSCIRTWRSTESDRVQSAESTLDTVVTRLCPACRAVSYFITPSKYWVDTKEDKAKLIAGYKLALSKKPCKYFKESGGEKCPFGGKCFYLHANPDGTKVVLPSPTRRRQQNQDGEFIILDENSFWNYLEVRDNSDLMS